MQADLRSRKWNCFSKDNLTFRVGEEVLLWESSLALNLLHPSQNRAQLPSLFSFSHTQKTKDYKVTGFYSVLSVKIVKITNTPKSSSEFGQVHLNHFSLAYKLANQISSTEVSFKACFLPTFGMCICQMRFLPLNLHSFSSMRQVVVLEFRNAC